MDEHQIERRALENGAHELRLPRALGAPSAVFGGFLPETIDYDAPLKPTDGDPLLLTVPADWRKSYFCLETPDRRHISAVRGPHFDDAVNFRDFGGYRAADGRRVRWGRLFRSGQLSRLSDADRDHLQQLDIRLIFDLRREEETEAQPPRLPQRNPPRVVALPITPGSAVSFFTNLQRSEEKSGEQLRSDMEQFMREVNHNLALGQQEQYSALFRQLLEQSSGGTLINCTAGKDRTGFAAAILLLTLGVPRETVMEDYLLSKRHIQALLGNMHWVARYQQRYGHDFDIEILRPMLEVQPSYLQTAFDAIDEEFAALEDYLEQVLGVDAAMRRELRERFLED